MTENPLPRAPTVPACLRLDGSVLRTADPDPAAPPDGPATYRLALEQWRYYAQNPEPGGVPAEHIRHWLVLPDGSEITSGRAGQAAIRSVTLEESVNDENELMPGAACAASIKVVLWAAARQEVRIKAGQEVACYRQMPGQQRELLGLFTAEQPTRASANTCALTAYDRLTRADKDLSPWLRAAQARFPMPLLAFARAVCAECGLELENDTLPNGDYPVQPFYADALTGRQLLQWVGQAAGCFCRATPQGRVRFGWYTPGPPGRGITPGGEARPVRLRLAGRVLRAAAAAPAEGPPVYRVGVEQLWYYADGLHYEDYATAPLDRVLLQQSENDAGIVWPPQAEDGNTLALTGNLLLANGEAGALREVAKTLYGALHTFAYTPCQATLSAACGLRAGMTVPVTDALGRHFLTCVMHCTLEGGSATLESTGSARRDASTAVTGRGLRNMRGKMLEIETSVDGLTVKASDMAGSIASLRVDVDGISTEVGEQGGRLSTLEQTAEAIRAEVTAGDNANKTLIEQTATDIRQEVTAGDSANKSLIEQNAAAIQLRVEKSGVISAINQSAEQVAIQANRISLQGAVSVNGTFKIDEQGYLQCIGGTIGGWQITSESIGNGKPYTGQGILDEKGIGATGIGTYGTNWAFWAGDGRFSVNQSGRLHAENADITGTVNANAGVFNSVTISGSTFSGTLDSPKGTLDNVGGSYVGSIDSGGTFKGTHSGGSLSRTTGSFIGTNSGTLTGTHSGGTVSSCTLGGTSLTMAGSSGDYIKSYSGGGVALSSGNAVAIYGSNFVDISGGDVRIDGYAKASKSLAVMGTKNRIIPTRHFGVRCLDSFETPNPTFADYGTARLDDTGLCCICIDPVFAETVNPAYRPVVFLTRYGTGELWVESVTHDLVTVRGTPNLAFAWETRYQQTNCDQGRLREYALESVMANDRDFSTEAAIDLEHTAPNMELLANEYLNLYAATAPDYGAEGANYYTRFERSLQ